MPQDTAETCLCRIIHEERVARAQQINLLAGETRELAQLFKTMGDPTRLKILLALEDGEMCVCDLAAFLEVSESAVSHQLRLLRQLNLVANRREGPVLYFRLGDRNVSRLVHLGQSCVRE